MLPHTFHTNCSDVMSCCPITDRFPDAPYRYAHLNSKGTRPETKTCLSPSPELSLLAARPLRGHQRPACRRKLGSTSSYGSNASVNPSFRLIPTVYAKQRYIPLPVTQVDTCVHGEIGVNRAGTSPRSPAYQRSLNGPAFPASLVTHSTVA